MRPFLSLSIVGLLSLGSLLTTFFPACTVRSDGVHAAPAPAKKRVVFIAGGCSHGAGEHEHKAGCMLLAKRLKQAVPALETEVFAGWPTTRNAFDQAAAVVIYGDGGDSHMVLKHLESMNDLMKKGVGLVCIHYAVEVPKGMAGNYFLDWIGGYFETYWSVNPVWNAEYRSLPKHAITTGVKPFATNDEWYYHMRFRKNMEGVTPILTTVPPASTLERKDGPHEGNPAVRAEAGQPQHMAWCRERPDGGRGFGITGGHYHRVWADDNVRKLVLNAISWVAKAEVPAGGIDSSKPSPEEMGQNLCPH
ncbi:ThuA domain-containing protein [Larkinella insperata]|uniref:ThuA domain-containing protein n=1 Tax=Larkinella insperata TaxID=332158 RepID=A0ABW3PZ67_9BACT|nr:ThuA domain-containing protein [Larkinella insperata]